MQDVREIIKEKGRWEGRREGRQEGRREGRREGRQEERKQVVLNMLKKELNISVISEVTGLSEEAIKQ